MAAFNLPNLSPTTLLLQSKERQILHHHHLHHNFVYYSPLSTTTTKLNSSSSPHYFGAQAQAQAQAEVVNHHPRGRGTEEERDDFYVNLGLAVRTLREDLPSLFTKDLNYHIYRDDITFLDPLNKFTGIENYKLIFWALRFHGRILFRDISLEVFRVWQPSENVILIRWNLKGVPRVPWEAKGEFQGTSRYKLDRKGKIYLHQVDNLAFNFPHHLKPSSVLDIVAAATSPATTPNPTFSFSLDHYYSSSWLDFYRAVKGTMNHHLSSPTQHCFLTCSSTF